MVKSLADHWQITSNGTRKTMCEPLILADVTSNTRKSLTFKEKKKLYIYSYIYIHAGNYKKGIV